MGVKSLEILGQILASLPLISYITLGKSSGF